MKKNIIFLGDSITAWNTSLKNIKNSENFGVPGFISRDIVWQLQGDYEENISGYTAIIMIGVNDLMMGISTEKIISNIEEIISILKNRFEKIIFISLLPIDNAKINSKIKKLNNYLKNINEIKFLDIYNFFINEHEIIDYKFTTDGIHLSNYGYEILNKELFKFISL